MEPAGQEIEVEVLAIDDRVPKTRKAPPEPTPVARPLWLRILEGIRHLPAYLWPLWIVLGALALVLLLTVGVAVGFVWLFWRGLRRLWRE